MQLRLLGIIRKMSGGSLFKQIRRGEVRCRWGRERRLGRARFKPGAATEMRSVSSSTSDFVAAPRNKILSDLGLLRSQELDGTLAV